MSSAAGADVTGSAPLFNVVPLLRPDRPLPEYTMWLSGGCGQLLIFLECDCAEQPAIVSCLRDLVLPRFSTAQHGNPLPGFATTTGFSTWHRFQVPSESTFYPLLTISCRSIWII
ncbi:hypothetical protein T07_5273 [Trichinella nelsoni]|uniref:Uncharacterized protein n=1 Tax=Trichinella nelsoni TaxID=6336 RepID=A0A0V0RJR1_9BILA|nr:hypothetical protein T07_5273 [Trichinella nelsoni]